MKTLSPPLAVLEEGLFGPSERLLQLIAFSPETVADEVIRSVIEVPRYAELIEALKSTEPFDVADTAPPMPEWMEDLIARRCQAQNTPFSTTPQPGQIRLIAEVIGPNGPLGLDLARPLSVCLNRPYTPDQTIWHAWLTTPETDYASYWDVLIEESDQPCDPQAGMVRLTQPVYVYLPSTQSVLGQLSPNRLAAIRSVAAEMLSEVRPEHESEPGFMLVRSTIDGHSVLTGTPLGGEDDPRWRYRQLYQALLPALSEPVERALDALRQQASTQAQPNRLPSMIKKLTERLGEQIQLIWQPMPGLVYAMGTAGTEADTLEGQLGDAVKIKAAASEYGMLNVWLKGCTPETLTVTVWCDGTIHEQHGLNDQTPGKRIELDVDRHYRLTLTDESGKTLAELDLGL
ncbi:MAG: hypothetical protein ACR2HF_09285 [Methylococcaceae bacterium]